MRIRKIVVTLVTGQVLLRVSHARGTLSSGSHQINYLLASDANEKFATEEAQIQTIHLLAKST